MAATSYNDAMRATLERLRPIGYEFGPSFVNHAPMAAEALSLLGYTDEVGDWLKENIRRRRYYDPPERRFDLTEDTEDWTGALGDFDRVADWSALFEREFAEEPWQDVLERWWPRLLPGMSGALTHGVIRTAHAIRSLAHATGDTTLQRAELAHGLGYWAARYWTGAQPGPDPDPVPEEALAERSAAALAGIDQVMIQSAEHYRSNPSTFPVPLIHAITGPAAVRLACAYLPARLHEASLQTARRCSESIRGGSTYGPSRTAASDEETTSYDPDQLVAEAFQVGDEHAIKLAEVAVRYHAAIPGGESLLTASALATRQIARFPI